MESTIPKTQVPSIASIYAQCFQVPVLAALNSQNSQEDIIDDYETFKEKMREGLEDKDAGRGLINRMEKQYRADLKSTLRQLSSDYPDVIEHLESDI
jgi:hypothetical protein